MHMHMVGQNPPCIWCMRKFIVFLGRNTGLPTLLLQLSTYLSFCLFDLKSPSSALQPLTRKKIPFYSQMFWQVVAIAKYVDFPIMFTNSPGCLSPFTKLKQGPLMSLQSPQTLDISRYTHKISWNWSYVCKLTIPTWDLHMFQLEEQRCRWTLLGQSLWSPGAIAVTNRAADFQVIFMSVFFTGDVLICFNSFSSINIINGSSPFRHYQALIITIHHYQPLITTNNH